MLRRRRRWRRRSRWAAHHQPLPLSSDIGEDQIGAFTDGVRERQQYRAARRRHRGDLVRRGGGHVLPYADVSQPRQHTYAVYIFCGASSQARHYDINPNLAFGWPNSEMVWTRQIAARNGRRLQRGHTLPAKIDAMFRSGILGFYGVRSPAGDTLKARASRSILSSDRLRSARSIAPT